MKSHAKVVIVGGCIMGVSLLYHLVKEGWTDIALIEKGELTLGYAAKLNPNNVRIHYQLFLLYRDVLRSIKSMIIYKI